MVPTLNESADLSIVDSNIYYRGKISKLYLLPTLLKTAIPAGLAIYIGCYINWPVVLTRPRLLIDGIMKYGLYLQPLFLIVILFLFLLSVFFFLQGIVAWLSNSYLITNDRIEYERGIFSVVILNLELWRVRDIFFHRSFMQSLLGLGIIEVIATDETIPRLEIGPLRNARYIYDQLKQGRLQSGRKAGAQAMGMTHL